MNRIQQLHNFGQSLWYDNIERRLLENGERPERILGGLRYAVEKTTYHPLESKKRLKFLLNCDTDIKTGRLKAEFALERLVVALCAGKL